MPFQKSRFVQNYASLVALALVATPILIALIFIVQFSVNVPFSDQWRFAGELEAYRTGEPQWLSLLWRQDDVHRQFIPRLLAMLLSTYTHWNIRVEMFVGFLLLLGILFVWWQIYRLHFDRSLFGFVPIAWLIFSLGQWENMLWGWQITVFTMVLSVTAGLCFLSRGPQWLPAAILCGLVGSFSFGNGLLIWPIGLLTLLLRKETIRVWGSWLLASLAAFLIYFFDYRPNLAEPPLTVGELLQHHWDFFLSFYVRILGAPLSGFNLTIALLIGIFLIGFIGYFLYTLFRRRSELDQASLLLLGLLIFALVSAALVALGRAVYLEPKWALSSRYVTSLSTLPAVLYLFVWKQHRLGNLHKGLLLLITAFILVGSSSMYLLGWERGRAHYQKLLLLQAALHTFEQQPDSALLGLTPFPEMIRTSGNYLRQEGLTTFGEAPRLLPLTIGGEGTPFGEIGRERPFQMQFKCPVAELVDFGILFATYGRTESAGVAVEILSGEETLFTSEVGINQLADNELYVFHLIQPIPDCYQRTLQLNITSPEATSEDAVTVWTYPSYYEAQILGQPDFSGNGLGIEMNLCHFNENRC